MRTLRRPRRSKQPLDEDLILSWADAYHADHGIWPMRTSGRIEAASSDETWTAIDVALKQGLRGLKDGSSLVQLLAERRGHRNNKGRPRLTDEMILAWADDHYARFGKWPTVRDGKVVSARDETWAGINRALELGNGACRAEQHCQDCLPRSEAGAIKKAIRWRSRKYTHGCRHSSVGMHGRRPSATVRSLRTLVKHGAASTLR
jgi:hypothetical protein